MHYNINAIMNKTELITQLRGNQVLNVFCVTTFPSQKNMNSTLTDDAPLVKIISNYITALNFSKKTVVTT